MLKTINVFLFFIADDEELYSDNRLEKYRLDDKVLVRQEYKRFLKDTKIKNIEISEGLKKYQSITHI